MNWCPIQGEEVQVVFNDGYVEIAKFIQDNKDGTSVVKVGRKQRHTVKNCNIYQNLPAYKKTEEDEDERY